MFKQWYIICRSHLKKKYRPDAKRKIYAGKLKFNFP